jgi:hypothetical protein
MVPEGDQHGSFNCGGCSMHSLFDQRHRRFIAGEEVFYGFLAQKLVETF